MFGKQPSDLTPADIQRVCDEGWTENDRLEFKRTLPADGKDGDPWVRGESQIGRPAKKALLRELVAFANAHGGWLLVGIEETNEKPGRAREPVPIGDCRDLADRLRLVCRDLIEPQLPVLQIEGIPMDESGAGVIACYAPQSRAAPHRSRLTNDAYYRRADRSEVMTMREIQDLTLNVERGMKAVEGRLEDRGKVFHGGYGDVATHSTNAFAIRISAMPLTPLFVPNIHAEAGVRPPLKSLRAVFGKSPPTELPAPRADPVWRPVLRGSQGKSEAKTYQIIREVHSDGLVDYRVLRREPDMPNVAIYPGFVMCLVANALVGIERFRRKAGAPASEYAMEVEFVLGTESQVETYNPRSAHDVIGHFPQGIQPFPRYSIGPSEGFSGVVSIFERDFMNVCGTDEDAAISIDFARTFPDEGFELWPPDWGLKVR